MHRFRSYCGVMHVEHVISTAKSQKRLFLFGELQTMAAPIPCGWQRKVSGMRIMKINPTPECGVALAGEYAALDRFCTEGPSSVTVLLSELGAIPRAICDTRDAPHTVQSLPPRSSFFSARSRLRIDIDRRKSARHEALKRNGQ